MKLTENFNLSEFDCNDGSETPCEVIVNLKEVALNLEVLRKKIGKPILINSGYRTKEYNQRVGGSPKSQHLLGKAADIRVTGLNPKQIHKMIWELIEQGEMKQGGLGLYENFVHYDIRGNKARW
jgi:uncharacterized protein YcbK (DUF882 family)